MMRLHLFRQISGNDILTHWRNLVFLYFYQVQWVWTNRVLSEELVSHGVEVFAFMQSIDTKLLGRRVPRANTCLCQRKSR